MMFKEVKINCPSRLRDIQVPPGFVPSNSKDHLIEVDLGFATNLVYKQDKLCFFLPDNVYYQKLTLVDGKGHAVKDDARSIIITGKIDETDMKHFAPDIYPKMPGAAIDITGVLLPFYPEINTELIIRGKEKSNAFYHFSCAKIVYKTGASSYLQLRYLGSYYYQGMVGLIRKWHSEPLESLENIPETL